MKVVLDLGINTKWPGTPPTEAEVEERRKLVEARAEKAKALIAASPFAGLVEYLEVGPTWAHIRFKRSYAFMNRRRAYSVHKLLNACYKL